MNSSVDMALVEGPPAEADLGALAMRGIAGDVAQGVWPASPEVYTDQPLGQHAEAVVVKSSGHTPRGPGLRTSNAQQSGASLKQPTQGNSWIKVSESAVEAMAGTAQEPVRSGLGEKAARGPSEVRAGAGLSAVTVETLTLEVVLAVGTEGRDLGMEYEECDLALEESGEQPMKSGIVTLYWLQRAMLNARAAGVNVRWEDCPRGGHRLTVLLVGAAVSLQTAV